MTSFAVEVGTNASAAAVWDVIRDIGALHTRLVPGFVTNSELVPGGRRVTFANGMTVIELIVSLDGNLHRLVWTAQGGASGVTHYNAAVRWKREVSWRCQFRRESRRMPRCRQRAHVLAVLLTSAIWATGADRVYNVSE